MGKDLSKVLDLYAQILMIKPPSTPETKLKTVRARAPSKLTDSATQPNSKSVTNTRGLPELLTRLSKAKNKAKATRKAIRDHWGLAEEHAEHIDAGLAFTAGSSTAQPVARPVPDGPARAVLVGKMLRAIVSDDPAFTVAFAGTSVSAGHDNWFNQSHPFCYERAFGPSFAAAGGALRVRNHAMGGNSVTPSHFCAPAQLDLRGDLDLAVYEFAMIAARDDCRFEYFVRSVLLLPRAPAFMAYTTSGLSWRNDDKGEASTVAAAGAYPGPKLLTKQTCKRKWMVDYYATAGAHYGDLAAIGHELGHLPQFVSSKMMGVRENCGGHPNTCKAIHGGGVPTDASVSLGVEDGDGGDSGDKRGGEKRGGGKKGGGGGGKKKQADPRRRRLAPFHPGPGAHEWTGQMLAHAHLALLIDAVEIAERAALAVSSTAGKEGKEAVAKLSSSLSSHWQPATPLPPPAGCHGPYCMSTSARCFSTYTPRSPEADLAALVVGPPLTVDVDTSDGQRARKQWVVALPPGADLEHHASFGYLDFKLSIRGDQTSGVLTLAFTTTLQANSDGGGGPGSPIVVCQPQCPWGKCKANQRLLHDKLSVKWGLDGKHLAPPDPKTLPAHDQAFDKEGVCIVVGYAPKGKHELTVEVLGGIVFISHLLFF